MMTDDWKETKLKDVCIKIGSGATPKGGKEAYLEKGGFALVRSQNVLDFSFSYDGLAYINEEQAAKLNNVSLQQDDVLLNITGDSVARVCQVPKEILPARVNQHVAIIRPDKEKLDQKFLKYYLLNPQFKNFMLGLSSVGGTRNALTKVMIEDFRLHLPNLTAQNRIASILSSLDDKIELNRQTNKTLEAIAQALFKEWFVDFNFPGATGEMQDSELGEIPKGWRVYKIGELVETVSITHKFPKGKAIFLNTSDIEEGKILHNNYSEKEGLPGQAKKSIKKLDILFTEIRPANRRYALIDFDADDFVVSTKLMVLRATSKIHPIVVYNYLTNSDTLKELQHLAESRSGTFPQITFDNVKTLKIALPEIELLEKYEKIAWSIFRQIKSNEEQTKTLTELRDSLLPKLMKGELSLKN